MNRNAKNHLDFTKHVFEIDARVCLTSIMNNFGTHFAESFSIFKRVFKIFCNHSLRYELSQQSGTLSLSNLLSQCHEFFSIISDVITSVGRFTRSSTKMLIQPCLNSADQYFMVDNECAVSQQTFLSST